MCLHLDTCTTSRRYILLVAASICTSTCAMAVLEPCLPIWLMDTIRSLHAVLLLNLVPGNILFYNKPKSCSALFPCHRAGPTSGSWGLCSCRTPSAT